MSKMKARKKSFVKKCKNGTIFYLDFWGENWGPRYEPFNIFYVKHNQFLIDRGGVVCRISEMNQKGWEFSAHTLKDFEQAGYKDEFHLVDEIKEAYNNMIK